MDTVVDTDDPVWTVPLPGLSEVFGQCAEDVAGRLVDAAVGTLK